MWRAYCALFSHVGIYVYFYFVTINNFKNQTPSYFSFVGVINLVFEVAINKYKDNHRRQVI